MAHYTGDTVTFKEAAHRLRVTVRLLKWYCKYAPKNDGRKLQFQNNGLIDVAQLDDFDQHLKSPWKSRYPPNGISEELRCEARGMCGVCLTPNDSLEEAHIDRKGKEVKHYVQHPHNLILLCPNCHRRYDGAGRAITNTVVRHAKDTLLGRLLEDLDRDVLLAKTLRDAALQLHGNLHLPNTGVREIASIVLPVAAPLSQAITSNARSAEQALHLTQRAFVTKFPISSAQAKATLDAEESGVDAVADDLWSYIEEYPPPEHECAQGDGSYALLEEWHCEKCGAHEYINEEPELVEYDTRRKRLSVTLQGDGKHTRDPIGCAKCRTNKHIHYTWSSFCSWCQHMAEKYEDD